MDWHCYLVRLNNNALYCGVSNNVAKRFEAHCLGKGAKALKGKGPLELVWQSQAMDKRSAMQLEWKVKRFPKSKKERLVTLGDDYVKILGESHQCA
jgi:putative endonuclease